MDTKTPELKRNVYVKDLNGSTMQIGETVYNGKVIHCVTVGTKIGKILTDLDSFKVKDEDVWILAYPKCGTHWLSEIAGIITSGELKPVPQEKESFMVDLQDNLSVIENLPSPRVINTHIHPKYLPEDIMKRSKVICVIRNPKSCAVSYYHHCSNRRRAYDYDGIFNGFLSLFKQGLDDISGSWFDYSQGCWDLLHGQSNVLFVFYEDLLKNTFAQIKTIGNFLGADKDDTFYEGVVELTSFSNMSKSLGKDETSEWHRRVSDSTGKNVFFRKGIIDDWKTHFTVQEHETFDKEYEEKMKQHQELKGKIQFE